MGASGLVKGFCELHKIRPLMDLETDDDGALVGLVGGAAAEGARAGLGGAPGLRPPERRPAGAGPPAGAPPPPAAGGTG